jgi:hypothetical protein
MAAVIKQQQPEVTEQATQEILAKSGFKVGSGLIKSIADKVLAMVQGIASYSFKQRFKESGLFGMAGDAIRSIFKKPKQQPIVEEVINKASTANTNLTNNTKAPDNKPFLQQQTNQTGIPTEKKLIQTEEKARLVLIEGITDEGVKSFKDKLPAVFKEIFKKLPKTDTKKDDSQTRFSEGGLIGLLPKGLLAMGGGLALLLGGLAALVTGLQTDGPFKGLLKIFSKVGLQGGLKMLEKGAKVFVDTLKSFIETPVKLVDEAATGLKGLFKNVLPKGISNILKGSAGLLSRLIVGVGKFLKPILTKIPLIGTLISWGFAYTRFKSGDVVGGIIDVLSGFVGLLSLTGVGAGVAIPIQIGLDVLNAFLDYKAGGASPEASKKKAGMIGDFFGGMWKWIKEKALNLFSWFINIGELYMKGQWGDLFQELAGWIPGLDWMLSWFGTSTEQMVKEGNELGGKAYDMVASFRDWVQTNIFDRITGFVGGIKNKLIAIGSAIGIGGKEEISDLSKTDVTPKKSARGSKPKLADGGVVTGPTEAIVGEAGDEAIVPLAKGGVATQPTTALIGEAGNEAVIPLEKYFNGKDFSLNNLTLEQIASNTGSTNDGLKQLGQAILKLAQVFNEKSTTGSNNIVINGQQQSQYPSASQVAASNVDAIRSIRRQFSMA